MYVVSVGSLKLKHWTKYIKFLRLAFAASKQAKNAIGCVHVKLLHRGDRFFVISVWDNVKCMKAYATSGVHRDVMANASETTSEARNITYPCDTIPKPDEAVEMWKSASK